MVCDFAPRDLEIRSEAKLAVVGKKSCITSCDWLNLFERPQVATQVNLLKLGQNLTKGESSMHRFELKAGEHNEDDIPSIPLPFVLQNAKKLIVDGRSLEEIRVDKGRAAVVQALGKLEKEEGLKLLILAMMMDAQFYQSLPEFRPRG